MLLRLLYISRPVLWINTVGPATVPKLMDVITPPGVDQSNEVDYTTHTPVVLSGVAIP